MTCSQFRLNLTNICSQSSNMNYAHMLPAATCKSLIYIRTSHMNSSYSSITYYIHLLTCEMHLSAHPWAMLYTLINSPVAYTHPLTCDTHSSIHPYHIHASFHLCHSRIHHSPVACTLTLTCGNVTCTDPLTCTIHSSTHL